MVHKKEHSKCIFMLQLQITTFYQIFTLMINHLTFAPTMSSERRGQGLASWQLFHTKNIQQFEKYSHIRCYFPICTSSQCHQARAPQETQKDLKEIKTNIQKSLFFKHVSQVGEIIIIYSDYSIKNYWRPKASE